jgi:lipoprotein signal peptidase
VEELAQGLTWVKTRATSIAFSMLQQTTDVIKLSITALTTVFEVRIFVSYVVPGLITIECDLIHSIAIVT